MAVWVIGALTFLGLPTHQIRRADVMQLGKLTRVSARSQTCIDRAAGPEPRRKAAGDNGKPDGKTTVIRIPGDRKMIIAPHGGDAWEPAKPRPDETLIRALARSGSACWAEVPIGG